MIISKNYYTISKKLSEQIFTELKQEHANMSKSEKEKEDLKIQQELNTMINSAEAEKRNMPGSFLLKNSLISKT